MKRNVGTVDRVLRMMLGLALLSLVFILQGSLGWIGLLGMVPLLTALVPFCPLYTVVGLSTCKTSLMTVT